MNNWTANQIASATGGRIAQGADTNPVWGVSIDSRTLRPGDLFVPIRGPKHDGHQFINAAFEKGAAGALVDTRWQMPPDFPAARLLIVVEDTHGALKDLAAERRRAWHGSLVGITGSMGKTTTKEFCAQMLARKYRVFRSPGNLNNLFGLPLALLQMEDQHVIGIFEMGMSTHGEIAEMCRIARPEIGVLTNIAPVHLQYFDSLEDIARAKGELAASLPTQGTLVYNIDDRLVAGLAAVFAGHKISFGFSEAAEIRAADIQVSNLRETRFQLWIRGKARAASIPMTGAHMVMNSLPAAALGVYYRIDEDSILEGLSRMAGAGMRGQIISFKEGFTVVDDSYNSNPRALMTMVETLAALPGSLRRILVAGEMLELGPAADVLHRECGRRAGRCGVHAVIGVQGMAREIVAGALEAGISPENAIFFETPEEAAVHLEMLLISGDTVLIKGSRGVHLEKVVQTLRLRFHEQAD